MIQLFRAFLLKEIQGWTHETALVEYLQEHPSPQQDPGFESVPDQSTLWRSWYKRFTPEFRETVETVARTILIKAQNAGISLPREPERNISFRDADGEESIPNDQTVLKQAETITDHVSRVVFPAFSLARGNGCEIHENAYWDLQTYLGLQENLAVNEDARSFIYESARKRTPLGHAHREHPRDLSIENIERCTSRL